MRVLAVLAPTVVAPVLAMVAITGCSSSSAPAAASSPSAAASSAKLLGTPRQQACVAVGDVLSDGPDPDADPVGYAQAQVLPLRQLKIANAPLRRAVQELSFAYQAFSARGGAAASATQVSKAEKAVDALCPGVAN